MKKFIILLLFLLFLSFNIMKTTSLAIANTNILKEGVYKISDLKFLTGKPDNLYSVQNVSSTGHTNVFIFNEHPHAVQFIELEPNSSKHNLVPLKPDYKIIVVGDAEIYIE